MEAALWGHIEILDFLLRQGADRHKIGKTVCSPSINSVVLVRASADHTLTGP